MKAEFRTTRNHAFVVHQDDLRKIWKLLEDRIGPVYASVECSDDVVRKFGDWEQLASYDNPPAKKMFDLLIRARSEDWKKSADVSFSYSPSDSQRRSIHIQIEAAEQAGLEIKDKICDILDGTKPWYSALTRVDFTGIVFIFLFSFLLTYTAGSLYMISNGLTWASEVSIKTGPEYYILYFFVLLLFGFTVYSTGQRLNKLWSLLFPVAYFAIGHGEHRYKILEKVHWGIIIASVVSLAASIVSLLLW